MDSIKNIIPQVIEKLSGRQPGAQESLEKIWKGVLKKEELNHIKLAGMNNGQVLAYVDSPAWLYQIQTRKSKILEQLKKETSGIRDINFKIGKV
jgi:hypothetical protein